MGGDINAVLDRAETQILDTPRTRYNRAQYLTFLHETMALDSWSQTEPNLHRD